VDDSVGILNAASDVVWRSGVASTHGKSRMALPHTTWITNKGRDLVALFDCLSDHGSTRDAGTTKNCKSHALHAPLALFIHAILSETETVSSKNHPESGEKKPELDDGCSKKMRRISGVDAKYFYRGPK
jgi:hypothetical protein